MAPPATGPGELSGVRDEEVRTRQYSTAPPTGDEMELSEVRAEELDQDKAMQYGPTHHYCHWSWWWEGAV